MNRLFKNIGMAFVMTLMGSAALAQTHKTTNHQKVTPPKTQQTYVSTGFDSHADMPDAVAKNNFTVAPPLDENAQTQAPTGFTIYYDSYTNRIDHFQISAQKAMPNGETQYLWMDMQFAPETGPGHEDRDLGYSVNELNIDGLSGNIDMNIGSEKDLKDGGSLFYNADKTNQRVFLLPHITGPVQFFIKNEKEEKITDRKLIKQIMDEFITHTRNAVDPDGNKKQEQILMHDRGVGLATYKNGQYVSGYDISNGARMKR